VALVSVTSPLRVGSWDPLTSLAVPSIVPPPNAGTFTCAPLAAMVIA